MKKILIILFLFLSISHPAQTNKDDSAKANKAEVRAKLDKLLNSKEIMMASLGLFQGNPGFINKTFVGSPYRSVWYHDSYFLFGLGNGNLIMPSEYKQSKQDTVKYSDFSIGATFAFKKLSLGRRLWDINGILLLPNASVVYTNLNMNHKNYGGLKIMPALSLQLPYFSIDARLSFDKRFKSDQYIRNFSIYPEIGFKLDGLYNLFDPEAVFNGHYEGTRTWSEVSYREEYNTVNHLDGSSTTYITTIKTTTTKSENYNFDSYARNVGPFLAIGPRYCFSNLFYSGKTAMFGIGFHGRMPKFGFDAFADAGKIGFASSYKNLETIYTPKPDNNKINKNDARLTGTYNSTRIGARFCADLYEFLMHAVYKGHSSDAGNYATKFTRLIGGIGGGFATFKNAKFDQSYATNYLDSLYSNDYTVLTTAFNDARYAENSPFINLFVSFEVGAVQLSMEWYRYKYAPLANTRTVTIGYMLPYKRMIKRYKALKGLKRQLR